MAYITEWLVEKRLVYYRGEGDITVEDVEDGVAQLHRFFDEGEAPIHTLSDNRFVGKFPTSLSTLKKLMASHPRATGWSLLVQEDATARFIGEVVTRFAGQGKVKSFSNLHDALAFLERIDPTLGTIANPEEA